ncbi:putative baseplate assembly protein [Micromonospora rubida]|uniref:Baseplate assembly protein n=1 Tax=Micromonospora rubida TaxID=2697657 RepID=A0ABW7SJA0_9ACTN
MADRYRCADAERRRQQTIEAGVLNGIDIIDVDNGATGLPPQRTLIVLCLLELPLDLTAAGVRVDGGVRQDPAVNPVRVQWAFRGDQLAAHPEVVTDADIALVADLPHQERLLVLRTSSTGDFSTYRLVVVDPARRGFDPELASAPFTFKLDCPSDFDPAAGTPADPPTEQVPVLDYLNRDFLGLRQQLLDRLSVVIPQWSDRNAADTGVMLVELFAYLGDHLGYAQDVVAAEAYLGTARLRRSVARHARLLDYPMHEGATARTWLVLTVEPDTDGRAVPTGTEVRDADDELTFHTLHPVTPTVTRNAIDIYTWGRQRCVLPVGAITATLVGTRAELGLTAGDVLIFEEVRGPDGAEAGVDVTHRHPVRLTADPRDVTDPATGARLVEVVWAEQDALPFELLLWRFPQGRCRPDVGAAVARGNVVLVEHGALVGPEPLVPELVPVTGRYRPALRQPGLAHSVPYDDPTARGLPAADALAVSARDTLAAVVRLADAQTDWTLRRDLLASDRFATEYVVEMSDDGTAVLRFGDDLVGRAPTPGTRLEVTYRVGGGLAGNCGRDVLIRWAVDGVSARNPLSAVGGVDPESVEQVRQWAPYAFRVQQRAVTDADYAEVTGRYPRVQRAAGTRRWTGSWYTEYVTVDRTGGADVDAAFRADVAAFLDPYRMAGVDVEVEAPVFVPLDIVLTICVAPGHLPGTVRQALVERFSTGVLPDGSRGYFHPDNFTFGQPVYLSPIVAAAMAIDGVAWVDSEVTPDKPNRFQRWGLPPAGERAAGLIATARLEVARCDSDPDRPEHGRIDFVLKGGD